MKFRNKVLSVLLAAGMVASMPAATAFNVMADDATVADAVTEESTVGASESIKITSTNYSKPSVTWSETATTVDSDTVNSITAKFYAVKNGETSPKELTDADGTVSYSRDITTGANCTTDGTVTITATYTSKNDVITATKTYTIKAYGHDYNFTGGTWTWTPTGKKNADGSDEYTATYTYSCKRDDDKQTVNATVTEDFEGDTDNKVPSCTSNSKVDYDASVKIGDKTYYPTTQIEKSAPNNANTKTAAVYKTDAKGQLIDADGKVLNKDGTTTPAKKFDELSTADQKNAVVTGYTSTGAAATDNGKADFVADYQRGHEWTAVEWDWNSKYVTNNKDTYLTDVAKNLNKDNTDILRNHYVQISADSNNNETASTDFVLVKVHCGSTFHTRGAYPTNGDGSRDNYVPAWIYVDHVKASCTEDSKTTYYAYVFSNKDDAKTQVTNLGTALGWDASKIDSEVSKAQDFFDKYQKDNIGNGYGSFAETKTDTWEGSALGHEYYISGWTWSNDFSYVTLNLRCDRNYPSDNYITVQSSQITKNADGTATVVYTAKDARKNSTNSTPWYGKDGYYLDQTKNPYGKEYTINALPLKNAGDVNNGKIVMTRLYNKTTGEHLYTSDANEIKTLVNEYNWTNEGTAWNAPAVSNTPVYRMFNRVTGEHVYTRDLNEVNTLSKKDEWNNEGIAWYSDDNKTVPVYRQFNPKAATSKASHNYTTSTNEKNTLTSQYGWNDEGIGWYGV